ncbi:MAG: CapA family protein [Alicyclobacillus sp.]|nr:CapA family protein [Alicyclobacillus sp.]
MSWLSASIATLQQGFERGEVTSADLVAGFISRIAEIDKQGPSINAVLEINPDAWQLAEALDAERRSGQVRGPLHGIPVLVKDNIDTADKLHTSAGSIALANHYAREDAFLVKRLRDAGAIILGKANMTEWANFMSDHMPNGYSSRGGQVLNPYGPGKFDVGGSSSGSAAAVAANLATAAVGTETSGSILSPASQNSLVGIKPTVGLISRSGIIPIAHSQDTAGPIARTVADAAVLLGVLTGIDPADPATRASFGRTHADYTLFLDPNGLRGARIGVPRKRFFGYSPEADRLVEDALEVMRREGAVIVDPADIPHADELGEHEWTVLLYEFKADLTAYLASLGPAAPVKTLRDVIAFNERNRERAMPYFGQDLKKIARQTVDLGADMVFGFHPHAIQGIEIYKGKPIAYSLGNFVMDQKRPITRESMIIRLDLAHDGVRSIDVIPAAIEEGRPRVLTGNEAAELMAKIRAISAELAK